MNILIVEDDTGYRNALREALEMNEHVVFTAGDGTEAFQFLGKQNVGLVISDINMPNCTGTQLHEMIRNDERYKMIPFIYVTGVAILRVATPLENGLDYMVSKVAFDRLLQLISDLCPEGRIMTSTNARVA